jgi:hypothetical protein
MPARVRDNRRRLRQSARIHLEGLGGIGSTSDAAGVSRSRAERADGRVELRAVIGLLEADGISVWIDGGWGVDALLGYQTREHDDLDLVIELDDATRVMRLLGSLGYETVAGGTAEELRDGR